MSGVSETSSRPLSTMASDPSAYSTKTGQQPPPAQNSCIPTTCFIPLLLIDVATNASPKASELGSLGRNGSRSLGRG